MSIRMNDADGGYLEDYAIKELWANRRLESNLVFKPARFTTELPRIGLINYQGFSLDLPDNTSRWHLYLMSAIPDHYINFNSTGLIGWKNLADIQSRDNSVVTCYEENGLVYPNSLIYVRRLPNGLLMLAVFAENMPRLLLGENDMYISFYRSPEHADVEVRGVLYRREADAVAWLRELRSYQNKEGYCTIFKNGHYQKTIDSNTTQLGDYLEFQYDSSVVKVQEFNVLALDSFTPTAPKTNYYLVMNWMEEKYTPPFHLSYKNDVTMFVTDLNNSDGALFKTTNPESVYQLTHQDLAVRVEDINYFARQRQRTGGNSNLTVITRADGQDQRWEADVSRVAELYQLRDKDLIRQALLGTTAFVDEWLGKSLMHSDYIKMIESDYEFMDGDVVVNAIGYYGVDNVLARQPITASDIRGVTYQLSPSVAKEFVKFSYDNNGLLTSYGQHLSTDTVMMDGSRAIEVYGGLLTDTIGVNEHYNIRELKLDFNYWYRFYIGEKDAFGNVLHWEEINTDHPNLNDYLSVDADGTFTWMVSPGKYDTVIRRSDTILELVNERTKQLAYTFDTKLAFGEIKVFVNKKPLVPNIDFLVKWPHLAICNKKYLDIVNADGDAEVLIIGMGFPDKEGGYTHLGEVGFVDYGKISFNNTYALRDYRNYSFSIDGQLKLLEDASWAEDDVTLKLKDTQVNGVPYSFTYPFSYLRQLDYQLTARKGIELSYDRDKRVSACLEYYRGITIPPLPPVFPNPYLLYSPFCTAVINDLSKGILTFTFEDINKHGLDALLADYKYLLDVDPCVVDKHIRWDIVDIESHIYTDPIYVTLDQYKIIEAINKYFLSNRVMITESVLIKY